MKIKHFYDRNNFMKKWLFSPKLVIDGTSSLDSQSGKSLSHQRLKKTHELSFITAFSLLYCVHRRCCVRAIWSSKIHILKAHTFLIVSSSCLLETRKVAYSLGWTLALHVDESDLPFQILLLLLPKYWDCRWAPPCPVYVVLGIHP